ncbi:MAG: deoxyribodipyrimidine photolyase [Sandaracinus sp.]
MSKSRGSVPPTRISILRDTEPRAGGAYVLYWMTAARRISYNFALERAVHWARELGKGLVVLEPLRIGYPWASDRFHAFVMDGMRDNEAALSGSGALYHPYVEPEAGAGKGLVEELAKDACVVVTDEAPFFFLPRMLAATSPRIPVRFEAIDGNGLVPLRAVTQSFTFAHQFRRFVQKTIRPHLEVLPASDPLRGAELVPVALPRAVSERWPRVPASDLAAPAALVSRLAIDHRVPIVEDRGGHAFAHKRLAAFVRSRLSAYHEDRSHPDDGAASGLSFHLHFGHLSAHEIFASLARHTDWSSEKLGAKAHGRREGFWNLSDAADAYLDELVTWRELGLARASRGRDTIGWADLPAFARTTLEAHASDPRPHAYDLGTLEEGRTHDPVWNATMRQLREEGRIQNYLRMLWGKKILEWSRRPEDALETMVTLNDRWSVDGRDPSSYTNIGWVLGLYDRPWAPERPIFGMVRYMSSDAAMKKLRMKEWMARWGEKGTSQRSLALD